MAAVAIPAQAAHRNLESYAALAAAVPQQGTATVSGTVADGSSKPLVDATVLIKDAAGVAQTGRTDSKGKYRISGLAPGTYTISVTAKGFKVFEVAGIPLAAGDSVPLDVLMEVGAPGEAATSNEPAGAAAPAQSAAASAPVETPQPQNEAPAWLNVSPTMPSPPPGVTPASIEPTVTENVENNGGTTAALTGTVTDSTGAVLTGATVTVTNASGFKQTATTNDKGVYTVRGLPPGAYDLSVTAPNFKTFQTSGLNLT
ncbi:MAG TPA: carboxypeptidase-like regulatory domain-containing protein, partial [Terriglobales bacterium]|nr:carboxypeptidase-like regulatory domain-containing protein [Terriglobales bacterium]